MTKTILKGTTVTLTTMLLLTACAGNQENIQPSSDKLSEATTSSNNHTTTKQGRYSKLLKKAQYEAKAKKIALRKFCFKDNHSIHYKAKERCD